MGKKAYLIIITAVPGQRQGSDTDGEQVEVILDDSAPLVQRLMVFNPFHAVLHILRVDPRRFH